MKLGHVIIAIEWYNHKANGYVASNNCTKFAVSHLPYLITVKVYVLFLLVYMTITKSFKFSTYVPKLQNALHQAIDVL